MSKTPPALKAPRRPEVVLPELGAQRSGPEPDGSYDGVAFEDADLGGSEAAGARFLECTLRNCSLDEAHWPRARLLDSVLEAVTGAGTQLASAELRDVELRDARMGGVQLHGAELSRVLVHGGKIDFLNLRQSRLLDVTFENCVLVEPDFGGAVLERVAFPGCVLRGADFSSAALTDVDLRDTAELEIAAGVGRLGGATISPAQLTALAPAFAAELGVRVEG